MARIGWTKGNLCAVAALFASLPCVFTLMACSSDPSSDEPASATGATLDGDAVARARLDLIRDQVRMPYDLASRPAVNTPPKPTARPWTGPAELVPAIGPSEVARFEPTPSGGLVPVFGDPDSNRRTAHVELPSNASQPVLLKDAKSDLAIEFAVEGASPARRQQVDGVALYSAVTPDGADVVHRAFAEGVEDYVYFPVRPGRSAVRYRVDVSKVPGLRLVENVLEFLNAKGDPRLRMKAPYLVGADGEVVEPSVTVNDCAYDANPAAPWDRAITPPGSDDCRVTVTWEDSKVRYPAVLDPGWTTTGSMVTPRVHFTATAIASNNILMAGGATAEQISTTLNSAELYNVPSGTCAVTGSMSQRRAGHAAALLPLGPVVVSGGFLRTGSSSPIVCLNTAELYSNGSWSNVSGHMKRERCFHTATLLSNYQVLMAGGLTGTTASAPTTSTDMYNWLSSSFVAATPSMSGARAYHEATFVPFGAERVLMTGGTNGSGVTYGAAEVYTLSTNGFSSAGTSAARVRHVAAAGQVAPPCVGDCQAIVLAGGFSSLSSTTGLNTVQYWLGTNFVSGGDSLSYTRGAIAGATVVGPSTTKNVLIAGGYSGATYRTQADLLRPGGGLADIVVRDAGQNGYHAYAEATTVSYGGSNNAVVVCGGAYQSVALAGCRRFVLQTNGQTCSQVGECQSGFCVDGVCCDGPCTATPCMACSSAKTGGTSGVCAPVAEGSDLDNECAATAPTTCGLTGGCSGKVVSTGSSCQLYPATTTCVEEHCSTSTMLEWTKCDGAGVCNQTGTQDCAPYSCVAVAGPDACGATCVDETQCASGQYCNGGVCVEKVEQGDPCDPAKVGQCQASLTCVDGVCCESACNGFCFACASAMTGQDDGLCRGVTAGTDPDDECTQSAEATCGDDGTCNGAGVCRKYDPTTECGTACQSNNAYFKHCNGGGACVQDSSVAAYCSPFACDPATGTCLTSCTLDAECQPGTTGRYCEGGTCLDKKSIGEYCSASNECISTFCIDSVCCDASCAGLCHACSAVMKGGGSDGTCEPVYSQKDPSNECTDSTTCMENGFCDGQGACGLYAAGTECGDLQCIGSIATGQMCNGLGTCVNDTNGQECSPYTCQTSVGCLTSCTDNQDCTTGNYCNALSQCVPTQADGASCTAGTQCSTNHCVDGVCCNQACDALCFACSAAKKGAGQDGACAEIESGVDPDNDCADEGACGLDGTCNGLGGCRLYASGSPCGSGAVCDGNVAKGQMCNGTGTCVDQPTGTDCTPHVCQVGVGCAKPCVSGADCQTGYYCAVSGDCLPSQADGTVCTSNDQCTSTHCVDGVCCDTSCSDPCQACSTATKQAGADGLCGPARADTDPHNDCVENPPTSCSYDGQCDGAGACRLHITGTACGPTSCDGNLIKGQTCDGVGTCVDNPTGTDCTPYLCENSVCLTSCATNDDCDTGTVCVDDACLSPGALGSACTDAAQCGSGWCVDGVCCNDECVGQCEACAVAGTVGVCAAVTGSPLGNRQPCDGTVPCKGSCDGIEKDACTYPGSVVVCGSTCANAEAQVATCDGTGECGTAVAQPCDPYICEDDSSCKLSCADSNDCVAPATCDSTGHCVEPGVDSGAGGSAGSGGSGGTGGSPGMDAGPDAAKPATSATSDSGCGCSVPGRDFPSEGRWAIAALLAGLVARRRRRSAR